MSLDTRKKTEVLLQGMKNGIPIGLGYLAVAFSLGIAARNAGVNAVQGFVASFFTIASAGEYAAFTLIGSNAAYWEMALVILVTNSRYLLMSCSMSQRLDSDLSFAHRLGMGALITDEIFGVSMAQEGNLRPEFTYGLGLSSVLPWAVGTALGILVGNILPAFIVSALSVALYGMFLAIIIPPARKSKIIAGIVLCSFLCSYFAECLPGIRDLSGGIRIVVLTLVLASAAAILFPVKEEANDA